QQIFWNTQFSHRTPLGQAVLISAAERTVLPVLSVLCPFLMSVDASLTHRSPEPTTTGDAPAFDSAVLLDLRPPNAECSRPSCASRRVASSLNTAESCAVGRACPSPV